MSVQAPESSSRGGNVFTRRIGPLPMWQWLLIALAMVGVYVIFQYRKKNQQAASASNTAGGTSTGGTAGAGQVPQFVNQTNTYVSPPSAQPPPPSGHAQPSPAPRPQPASPGAIVSSQIPPVGGIYVPPGQVNIPNILGGPVSDAIAVIKSRGLIPVVPNYTGNPVVTNQSPIGGLNATPGTKVTLSLA